MGQLRKAIFLDRDGVINKWIHPGEGAAEDERFYILSWDQFEFIPEALEGLALLAQTDYLIFVVSNQSGIGKGLVDYSIIDDIFVYMTTEIEIEEGRIDDYLFCHHAPDFGCCCRKPQPGMIYSLAREYDVDIKNSWIVGDSASDMVAGANAGIQHRVKIGDAMKNLAPHITFYCPVTASNLKEAAEFIIAST